MVKADGYGLGAVRVARALERARSVGLRRRHGRRRRGAARGRHHAADHRLHAAPAATRSTRCVAPISRPRSAIAPAIESWARTGRGRGTSQIDTGMSRAGHARGIAVERLPRRCSRARARGRVHALPLGRAGRRHRARAGATLRRGARARCPRGPRCVHAENSAGGRASRAVARGTLVRPGDLPLRRRQRRRRDARAGAGRAAPRAHRRAPRRRRRRDGELRRDVARARARAASPRCRVGYADGYRRALEQPRRRARSRGQRVPVAGMRHDGHDDARRHRHAVRRRRRRDAASGATATTCITVDELARAGRAVARTSCSPGCALRLPRVLPSRRRGG